MSSRLDRSRQLSHASSSGGDVQGSKDSNSSNNSKSNISAGNNKFIQSPPAVSSSSGISIINNELISAVSGLGLNEFRGLTSLDLHLRGDAIGKIIKIENLSAVPNLVQLNLSFNAITKIEGLNLLLRLVDLNLAENGISKIENLESLINLERLNLAGNNIKRIPESMSALKNLQVLRLSRNQIDVIRDVANLRNNANLSNIRLDENPISLLAQFRNYTVFNLPMVDSLNGSAVTDGDREAATRQFASSGETAKLSLDGGKEVSKAMQLVAMRQRLNAESSAHTKALIELEDVSQKLADASADALVAHEMVSNFERNRSSQINATNTPVRQTSNNLGNSQNLRREDLATSMSKSRRAGGGGEGSPGLDDFAARKFKELQERLERLTEKLFQSENEKHAIKSELMSLKGTFLSPDDTTGKGGGGGSSSGGYGHPSKEIEDLKTEINRLNYRNQSLENALKVNEATVVDLKAQLVLQESSCPNCVALKVSIMELNKELDGLRDSMFEKHTSTDSIARELSSSQEKLLRLQTEHDSLKLSALMLEKTQREQEILVTGLTNDLEASRSYGATLEQQTAQLNDRVTTLLKDKQSLMAINDDLEKDMQSYLNAGKEHASRFKASMEERSKYQAANKSRSSSMFWASRDVRREASNGSSNNNKNNNNNASSGSGSGGIKGYFEDVSSDTDEIDVMDGGGINRAFPTSKRTGGFGSLRNGSGSKRGNRSPLQAQQFSPGKLETAAAGAIAHMIFEEIGQLKQLQGLPDAQYHHQQQHQANNRGGGGGAARTSTTHSSSSKQHDSKDGDNSQALYDACAKIAAKLLHNAAIAKKSILHASNSNNFSSKLDASVDEGKQYSPNSSFEMNSSEIGDNFPFQMLGDRDVLAKIVADVQSEMFAIDDVKLLLKEHKQIQLVIEELEERKNELQKSVSEKDATLKELNIRCLDVNNRLQRALDDVNTSNLRLDKSSEEQSRVEFETKKAQKELDMVRSSLSDAIAMNEIEHRNISIGKDRNRELRLEVENLDAQLFRNKERISNEEMKVKSIKSVASEQLRVLQSDLNKLQGDVRSKQKAVDDLEKYHRLVEEEGEVRKRDIENQVIAAARQLEEENMKLISLRADIRTGRSEIEQLVSQRRQLELERNRLTDASIAEKSKLETLETDYKLRIEDSERVLSDLEKKVKASKDKLTATDNENVLLRHAVDELRRQLSDLEKTTDSRRKNSEDEVAQAQQQAQLSLRSHRHAIALAEQKKAEVEALTIEARTVERKYEEVKRSLREHEILLDETRESLRANNLDLERGRKDLAATRKEELEAKYQAQISRSQLENDTKAFEEIRRRTAMLVEEENSLKDCEMKLKSSVQQLRNQIEEAHKVLEEDQSSSERERRSLADSRSKRIVIETDINRLQQELKFIQQQAFDENKRRTEEEAALSRLQDEIHRAQKDVLTAQRKVSDEERKQGDIKREESEMKIIQERMKSEMDSMSALMGEEKNRVDALRSENRELAIELRRTKEEHKILSAQHIKLNSVNESLNLQIDQSENIRNRLTDEISQLRELCNVEMRRTERLDSSYKDMEARLRELREQISVAEVALEKVKSQSVDEDRRVNDQRKILRATMEELSNIEVAISDSNKKLYEERQRALAEIGQLDLARQSAQSHIFYLAETQKKMASAQPASNSGGGVLSAGPSALSNKSNSISSGGGGGGGNSSGSTSSSKVSIHQLHPTMRSLPMENDLLRATSHYSTGSASRKFDSMLSGNNIATRADLGVVSQVNMEPSTSSSSSFSNSSSLHAGHSSSSAEEAISFDHLRREVDKLKAQSGPFLTSLSSSLAPGT